MKKIDWNRVLKVTWSVCWRLIVVVILGLGVFWLSYKGWIPHDVAETVTMLIAVFMGFTAGFATS